MSRLRHIVWLRFEWHLCIMETGEPMLRNFGAGSHGGERASLLCIANQPHTMRLLRRRLSSWLEPAARYFAADDPAMLGASKALLQLDGWLALLDAEAA